MTAWILVSDVLLCAGRHHTLKLNSILFYVLRDVSFDMWTFLSHFAHMEVAMAGLEQSDPTPSQFCYLTPPKVVKESLLLRQPFRHGSLLIVCATICHNTVA